MRFRLRTFFLLFFLAALLLGLFSGGYMRHLADLLTPVPAGHYEVRAYSASERCGNLGVTDEPVELTFTVCAVPPASFTLYSCNDTGRSPDDAAPNTIRLGSGPPSVEIACVSGHAAPMGFNVQATFRVQCVRGAFTILDDVSGDVLFSTTEFCDSQCYGSVEVTSRIKESLRQTCSSGVLVPVMSLRDNASGRRTLILLGVKTQYSVDNSDNSGNTIPNWLGRERGP
jgi:hypothetical protein